MIGKIHSSALIILYAYEMLCLTNSKNIFQRLKIYLTSVNHKRCYLCSIIKILIKIHPRMCNPALSAMDKPCVEGKKRAKSNFVKSCHQREMFS